MDPLAIAGSDASALLATVLKGVQAVEG